MSKKKIKPMWAVMKAQSFSSIEINGIPLSVPANKNLPTAFIPLFETREQAVAFDNGSGAHIAKVEHATVEVRS